MRGASLFPPTGQGRPAQLPDPCSASRSCPLARSLLGLWPQTGRQMGKDDPGSRPSPLSGLRAVPCVCASLFSSLWLMKYLGSLSCSPVSAFRFGFPDLSWGWGWGAVPCLFPLPWGRPEGPHHGNASAHASLVTLQDISFPCGLSCRAPSVMCRGGSWITSQSPCPYQNTLLCPVSPWGVSVGQGVAILSPGAPGAGRPLVGCRMPTVGSPGLTHTWVPAHAPQP